MSIYTPGPWDAKVGRTSWGGPLPPIVMAGKHKLAIVESSETLYTADGNDTDAEAQKSRDEANARLMSAAPELLAICREISKAGYLLDHSSSRVRLYAAIAKATGETL